jgi:hypothetical protein
MLRLPMPTALAALIAAGAAAVCFYITAVENPTQGAWTDRNGTALTFVVPAGGSYYFTAYP